MTKRPSPNAPPLITTIRRLFSEDLVRENDFLRQENKILRSKLGKRVPLTDTDRRALVRYAFLSGNALPKSSPSSVPKPHWHGTGG